MTGADHFILSLEIPPRGERSCFQFQEAFDILSWNFFLVVLGYIHFLYAGNGAGPITDEAEGSHSPQPSCPRQERSHACNGRTSVVAQNPRRHQDRWVAPKEAFVKYLPAGK